MISINKVIKKIFDVEQVYAHCDVPCGIYDPYPLLINAHTIIRMVDLMDSLDKNDPEYELKMARYIAVKEEHGELAKHEIRVIWGDFFKPENSKEFPDLSDKVWKLMRLGSKARQSASRKHAEEFLEGCLEFAEIFWKIKGKGSRRVPAPWTTGGELVLPEL